MTHQTPVQLPRGRPRSFDTEAAVERAMGVFWSRGYHATALPDLLRATKLSRGSLYAAFGDKHSLFLRALDRYIADALTRMDIELAPRREPVDGLRAYLAGYVDRTSGANGRRGCLLVATAMELAGHDAEVDRRIGSFFKAMEARVADALSRAKAAGKLADGVEPSSAARILVCFVEGLRVVGKTAPARTRRKPPSTLFSTASSGRQPMDASAVGASISGPIGLERKDAMSAIQIVCAVAVPLLWGYQFVAIKVGVMEFPPLFFLALRFLAIALLLVPFVKRPTTSTVRPYRSYFGFSWWTELRALLCWPWARLGKHVGRRLSTRHALHRPVSLAAARGEAVSDYVRRSAACLCRRGRVGGGAWPVGKRASAPACGRGSLRVRGVQRLDQTLRPF